MFCRNCGFQCDDNTSYCPNCGMRLNSAQPQSAYSDNHRETPQDDAKTLSIAGFVLSFVMPVIGLVLSIIAYNQAKAFATSSRTFAKAGIIISAIAIGLSLLAVILMIALFSNLVTGIIYEYTYISTSMVNLL